MGSGARIQSPQHPEGGAQAGVGVQTDGHPDDSDERRLDERVEDRAGRIDPDRHAERRVERPEQEEVEAVGEERLLAKRKQ